MTRRGTVVSLMVLGAVGSAVGLTGCSSAGDPWAGMNGRPRVVVSFPPLYSFVTSVGGDHPAVKCLCTVTGPHHYKGDRDVQDSLALREADLFLINGLGLEEKGFADRMANNSGNNKLRPAAGYVKIGSKISDDLIREMEHDHHDHAGHAHHHHDNDPHIWLGTPQVVAMIDVIRDELTKADPDHADDYKANAKKYQNEIRELEEYGKKLFKDKKNRKLITFHESLGYFGSCFDLNIVDVIQEGPGNDPKSARMARLLKKCREEDVRVIAVEPQYSKETSASLLRDELKKNDLKVTLVEIDPLETADPDELAPDWYVKKMKANLEALAKALE